MSLSSMLWFDMNGIDSVDLIPLNGLTELLGDRSLSLSPEASVLFENTRDMLVLIFLL